MPEETNTNPQDLSFDDIFDGQVSATPQPQAAPTPEPQAPTTREPYLRTPSGTVYWTREDAERGYEEKDRTIESQRQWAIATTGYDPISGKPVRMTPYTQDVNYSEDPETFYKHLAEANEKKDARAFSNVMLKMVKDAFLEPYAPVLTQSARAVAIDSLERDPRYKGIREFVDGPGFQESVGSIPLLKNAIDQASTRPELTAQLQDLYKLAYRTHQGERMPEIIQSARQQAQPAESTPRPTLQPSAQPVATNVGGTPDLSTPEGRAAIIANAKAKGIDRMNLFSGGF